jgi:Fur family ferric uptake transcriptional regulator
MPSATARTIAGERRSGNFSQKMATTPGAAQGLLHWAGMAHTSLNYCRVLREAGFRVTDQREVILDAVCAGSGHSTLKEIYLRAQERITSLDRSSVYRALKLFVELGLVVAGVNIDGEDVYEITQADPHHHLICRQCGAEQEIAHDVIEGLYAAMHERYRFRVTSDHLVLFGVCARCDEATSPPA